MPKTSLQSLTLIAVLAALPLLVGCGGFTTAEVAGKVTVGDQPLTGGRVMFSPVGEGEVGPTKFAEIQPDGAYSVDGGAVVGLNKVRVLPPYRADDEESNFEKEAASGYVAFQPPTDLEIEVKAGEPNNFDIPLQPKKSRRGEEDDD